MLDPARLYTFTHAGADDDMLLHSLLASSCACLGAESIWVGPPGVPHQ